MLVTHIFPSDGEYTLLVESVFGDNMAGGNFGSVPCEKIEVLLDSERLQLIDWAAGRGGGGELWRPGWRPAGRRPGRRLKVADRAVAGSKGAAAHGRASE